METKIIKQEKNPFLEREEFLLEIKNETTPTFDEVKSEIGKNANLIVVKKVNTNFGRQIFLTEAVVYDSIESKEKIETIPQKVRKKMKADKKAEEESKKKAEEETKKIEEAKEDTSIKKEAQSDNKIEETKEEKVESGNQE